MPKIQDTQSLRSRVRASAGIAAVVSAAGLAWVTPLAADDADGWTAAANSRARLNWCGQDSGMPIIPDAYELAFVELQIEPGWKTYWRVPGDAGVPPDFDWTGSSNVAKATVFYPAPHRLADAGGEAIGYKLSVVFPVRIERKAANVPTPVVLTMNFGVCKNICVPVEVNLTGACYGGGRSPAIAAAVEAVPHAPGQRATLDPKFIGVRGSVLDVVPRLTIDVDYAPGATDADLFIEAPSGLFVPLPARATPDAQGRAHFTVDLRKTVDPKDLLGKELRLTMVSSKGASEALWVAK